MLGQCRALFKTCENNFWFFIILVSKLIYFDTLIKDVSFVLHFLLQSKLTTHASARGLTIELAHTRALTNPTKWLECPPPHIMRSNLSYQRHARGKLFDSQYYVYGNIMFSRSYGMDKSEAIVLIYLSPYAP